MKANSVIYSACSVEFPCKDDAVILRRADGGKWIAKQYLLYVQLTPSPVRRTQDEARNFAMQAVLAEISNGRVMELEDGINMHIIACRRAGLRPSGKGK